MNLKNKKNIKKIEINLSRKIYIKYLYMYIHHFNNNLLK